jgi:hypothetical protein
MKNLLYTAIFAILSVSLIAQTDVLPPVLDKPADAAVNQMPNVELDWYAVSGSGQISYQVQIDTNNLFPTSVSYITQFTARKAENLLFGESYFWRVRAIDGSDTSGWSVVRSLTIFNEVALNKPDNNAVNQSPNVRLIWSNRKGANFITGITYYDLQISYTDDFADPFLDSVTYGTFPSDTNFYLYRTSYLLFGQMHYWRVRARHTLDASEWSEVRTFTTVSGVTLTTPANNAVNQNSDIELKWEAIPGITKFVYQLCTDPNFTFPCITDFTETNSVIIPSLSFGVSYHWRVKAIHPMDTTDWSQERTFQVINTVLLSSPQNGATGINSLPKFVWSPIAGADKYEVVWYNTDYSMTDTAFSPTASFQTFKPLEMGHDYFWKVRAYNGIEITNWSETWQFFTGTQAVTDLTSPQNLFRIFPNPSNGELSLELNSSNATVVQVSIVDFVGKLVFDNSFAFQQGLDKKTINLRHLNDGLYFIRFKSGESVYTEKLVINK